MKRKRSRNIHIHNTLRQGYEAKVIGESLKRAGNNPQLKGIVHEVMIKDGINYNPVNMVKGVNAALTKSTNAKTVDIVVKQGGKIVGRIQAKDAANSISNVVKQVKSGQYNSATIVGTRETAAKLSARFAKDGISKTVKSSGISSKTTQAIAAKAGVNGLSGLSKACSTAAKGSAVTGAVVGAGVAVVKGIGELADGSKAGTEVAKDVVKEAAGSGLSAAGAGAAATAGGAVVASAVAAAGVTGAAATALTVGAPVAIAVGVGCLIKSFWDSIFD